MPDMMASESSILTLADMARHDIAYVTGFAASNSDMETRLREIGFAEGDEVEPLHHGLIRRNPMTVRLNSAMVALRRNEARCILVAPQNSAEA